ncbi:MAG TPA: hypothetical protein PKD64_09965 [Pirellulaceae bacterium]|nr:hypothetical protein [Pirellulaceae bacterium]HMO92506.1 hypothetical protein [Pirellulaceae bacterium]HMP69011.1 hypothetical protein [Pirellulaceae bacterium]
MSQSPKEYTPLFQYEVSTEQPNAVIGHSKHETSNEVVDLLRQLVIGQDRQNELLEELVEQMNAQQRQRANELGQWKDANPILARRCRLAAEALGQVQTEFLHSMTVDVNENYEAMMEGDFVLNEFVDKYGPRLAHLNGVLQLLSQLGSNNHNHSSL